MKTRNILLTVLTAVLALISYSVVADPPDPPDPHQGASQPTRERNLDDDGWIAVHEQGTAKVEVQGAVDVNVTGGQIDANVSNTVQVQGTVSVDNFPGQQEVFINAGELSSITTIWSEKWIIEGGKFRYEPFPQGTIQATTVFFSDRNDNTTVTFYNSAFPLLTYRDPDRVVPFVTDSFTYPIPLDAVKLNCFASLGDNCVVEISVFGF